MSTFYRLTCRQVCKAGAWVENKGALLTFHYRETPIDVRPEMVAQAKALIEAHGFRAGEAHCALEAKPPVQWNKGRASIYILRTAFGLDWSERIRIIYAGDDVTDEDAMEALKGMAATSAWPSRALWKTAAQRRLPSTDSVLPCSSGSSGTSASGPRPGTASQPSASCPCDNSRAQNSNVAALGHQTIIVCTEILVEVNRTQN
ncbi:hypothetical protein LSTR_LSTR014288 [Laodelphax striatellus]|uniref:Trehalose 6-phosphate phosphatase n=1 Tax=Laodelphax striatellus TaxID=195883 RepID=A0A482WQZ0_LAOST|nr:hypothetical protein LSTR_LSTR014288 [Laodelphax striatellus]